MASSLCIGVPQFDVAARAALQPAGPASGSGAAVGDKAFFGVGSARRLSASLSGNAERSSRVPVVSNVRATAAASKVVKDKPKSADKDKSSSLVSAQFHAI